MEKYDNLVRFNMQRAIYPRPMAHNRALNAIKYMGYTVMTIILLTGLVMVWGAIAVMFTNVK
jgi:hypothetical protein